MSDFYEAFLSLNTTDFIQVSIMLFICVCILVTIFVLTMIKKEKK